MQSDVNSLTLIFEFALWFLKRSVTVLGITISIWSIFGTFFVVYLICNSFKSMK